jgi:hypothetical protein|tara:strand:+ start:717 stop:1088 length:372 start_codon:yes stop_codon:yes gene_type:complete
MAVTTSTASAPLVTTIVTDIDADTTLEIIAAGNKTVYAVEISNPNTNEAVYVHMIPTASGSSSSTQHTTQLYCPANTTMYYYAPLGYLTSTGIQCYCTTSAGGGANALAPTSDVQIKFGYTAR